MTFRKALAAAVTALAATLPFEASAQTSLKFAHVFPGDHYLWEHGGKFFVEQVKEKTGGRVDFQVFPAGQLGKDYVSLLKSSVVESALLVPSYTPQALPLTSVSELPGFYSDSCEATEMLWSVAKEGGALNEAEYAPQGMHVLFVSTLPPFKVLTASKEIVTPDDMSGLKIRANGAAMDKTIKSLQGTPIRVTAGELYDSLSRGTVDGGFFPFHSVPTYDLQSVLRYGVEGPQLGSGSVVFAISERTWSRIDPKDQTIMTEAAQSAQRNLCEWMDAEETRVRDELVSEHGFEIVEPEGEALAKWQAAVETVATDWAAELDASGRPGTAVLDAFGAAKQ